MKYLLFIITLFSIACNNSTSNTGKCPMGQPVAMFDKTMAGIQNHKFEVKEQNSTESAVLPEMNMSLEILQSGCEKVSQEWRFLLNGTVKEVQSAPQTAELVADILAGIYDMDKAKLLGFRDLAQTVGMNAPKFQFGEQLQVTDSQGTNLVLGIEKINQPDKTLLILTIIL